MASSIFTIDGATLTVGSTTLFQDGIAAAPAIAWVSDTTTGIRRSGLGVLIFDSQGIDSLAFGGTATGIILNAASPLTWGSAVLTAPDVSLRRNAGTNLTLALSGTDQAKFTANNLFFRDAENVGWTSSGDPAGTADAYFSHPVGATGKIQINSASTPFLMFGGATASFPAIKQSSTEILFRLADDSAFAGIQTSRCLIQTNGNLAFVGAIAYSVAPTISSGFGTGPSIVNQNGSMSFSINVGTGAAASSGVIGLPAAANGWNVEVTDITAAAGHTGLRTYQTATTTTTATIESQNSAGAATAWASASVLHLTATAR